MSRFKLTIQYDGTLFFGWQIQASVRTVQGEVEQALLNIDKSTQRIPVHGSGRTDTGVHATGQVAHFDLATKLGERELKDALNAHLSENCRIMSIEKVTDKFHARFDAVRRHYRYQCYVGDSILYRNQAWCLRVPDIQRLNQLAALVIGDHDFQSFGKYRLDQKNTHCTIYQAEWKGQGDFVNFFIAGNRFLHHMVRYLVGTMVKTSQGNFSQDGFESLLLEPQKDARVQKAPPQGLFLEKVDYVD